MKPLGLTGLIAAPFTPFLPDLTLNLAIIPKVAEHLVRHGVTGVFVNGSTGEYASLTREERLAQSEAWRKVTGPKLKLIVHVGHNSLVECQALAQHAESVAADAIGALMPSYFRPPTLAATVEFCRQIAEAAPKTPFYYYHIPHMTGVNFDMRELLPEISKRVPTFAGIKFTGNNLLDYSLSLAAAGADFDIPFGFDDILLAALSLGARAAVGSTYNFAAPLFHKMIQAHRAGQREAARQHQVYIQKMSAAFGPVGWLPASKVIMARLGLDCGPARPPFPVLTEELKAAFNAELDKLDFFNAVRI